MCPRGHLCPSHRHQRRWSARRFLANRRHPDLVKLRWIVIIHPPSHQREVPNSCQLPGVFMPTAGKKSIQLQRSRSVWQHGKCAKQTCIQTLSPSWEEEAFQMNSKSHTLFCLAALIILCFAPVVASLASPPDNADPSLSVWFQSLTAPNGTGCCELADCRRTEFRITAESYEAKIEDIWVSVPWERVLRRTDNPTGQAVVCYLPHTQTILCFVRPSDS